MLPFTREICQHNTAADYLRVFAQAKALSLPLTVGFAQSNGHTISVDITRLTKLLNIKLTGQVIRRELLKLGFITVIAGAGSVSITVPWWRPDVLLPEDIAEELIRLIGYDSVPTTLPAWKPDSIEADQYWNKVWRVKNVLKAKGLFEIVSYSFVSAQLLESTNFDPKTHLQLLNPLSQDQAYLRSNLLPSLVNVVARNNHYAKEFGLYEVSRVFVKKKTGQQPHEPKQLGVMIRGSGTEPYSLVKGVLDALEREFAVSFTIKLKTYPDLHPARSAEVLYGKQVLGRLGQLHPEIAQGFKVSTGVGYLELDLNLLFACAGQPYFVVQSKFPPIHRDLAIVIDRHISWADIEATLKASQLAAISYLNDFTGEGIEAGHKSLAMRLRLYCDDRTMTDAEADARLAEIFDLLKQKYSATLRQ